MEFGLRGRKIAVIAGSGIDRAELDESLKALEQAGAELHLLGTGEGDGGRTQHRIDEANPADFVALLLPGGDVGQLAGNRKAIDFVREMMEADKPVAAIGKGAALLLAANAVRGRTLAADPSLKQQLADAGGSWSDKSLQVDQKLITTANYKAIPTLGKRLATELSNKLDSAKVDQLSQQSFPASDPPPGPGSIGAASVKAKPDGEARPL